MEYADFLAEKFNGLSEKDKNKVMAYFPAIAGPKMASMSPISGIKASFNSACRGNDTNAYAQCLADAVALAQTGSGDSPTLCYRRSTHLAKMLGVASVSGDFQTVLGSIGFKDFEITSEKYDDWDDPDPEDNWYDEEEELEYEFMSRKSVTDSDGYITEYTWYRDSDGRHVFVFGDSDLYHPEDGNFDYECDSYEEAREWFESYQSEVVEREESDIPEEPSRTENPMPAPIEETPPVSETVDKKVEESAEVDDSADEEPNKVEDIDRQLIACFGNKIPNYVDKVLIAYDLIYESGFDLRRPYGVLGAEGVYYVDRNNHCALRSESYDMDFSTSIKMYSLFQGKLGFNEKPCRSTGVIGMEVVNQYMANPSKIMYFPQKCLEIMYGRVPATAKKELNGERIIYFAPSKNMNSWKAYRDDDIKTHLAKLLFACARVYIEKYGLQSSLRTEESVNRVEGLLDYAVSCLTSGIFVIDYKTSNGSPVMFKVRVSDPVGSLDMKVNYTEEIIKAAFSGNFGGAASKRVSSGLDNELSTKCRVYEYAHEFNHQLSNATPLFAYKALEVLQARGDKVTWDSAIVGQSLNDTILRNGSVSIDMNTRLFHHINAGSRAGKGVMTLNMLASGIASNKAIFYLDNKPDMASMLSAMAHSDGSNPNSVNGPDMFVVNGHNFEKDVEKEFIHRDSWIIPEHIPQELRTALSCGTSWAELGSLFYMRAYMLCLGIVLARGSSGDNYKRNDPLFGGEEGLMIVADEFNNLQNNLLGIISKLARTIPPLTTGYNKRLRAIKSAAGDPKKKAKIEELVEPFSAMFTGAGYYSLSLLNSYANAITSLANKKNSGFENDEISLSDIFVIGQDLEHVPIGDLETLLKTTRYTGDRDSVGINKSEDGLRVITQSIPYQLTMFRTIDAFIGYNAEKRHYLKQDDPKSKAYGVLDDISRGFAYVHSFEPPKTGVKPAAQFDSLDKANAQGTVYFKPYLILNECAPSSYVDNMFRFAYAGGKGATKEQIIAEYPDYKDPTKLNRHVGFREYMEMMGLEDLQGRLSKGANIANHVVSKYLGYTGKEGCNLPLWLQFVTDLRVEWIFSPEDVWALCTGNIGYNLGKGVNSEITGEYYKYVKDLSELQLIGVEIMDSSLTPSVLSGGDGSYLESDAEAFEEKAGFTSTEDGSDPEAESRRESKRVSRAMGDYEDIDPSDFESVSMVDDDEDDASEEELAKTRSGLDAFNFTATNAAGSHREVDTGSVGYTTVSEAMSSVNMEAVNKALDVLKANGYNVSVDMGGYSVGNDGKIVTNYVPAPDQRDMSDLFAESSNTIDSDKEFQQLVNDITDRVIKDYGGVQRIKSFGVIGDSIVINGTMYRCKLGAGVANRLYVDLRREVNAGNICRLFNYKMLAGMTELTEIRCDSATFMYEYINYGAFGSCDVPVRAYFDAFEKLKVLQIGKEKYTRESVYSEDAKSPYYIQSKSSKFFDSVHDGSKKWNKGAWSWGKSKLTDKKSKWYQKVLWTPIAVGVVGATAVTRGASAVVSTAVSSADKRRAKKEHEKKIGGFVSNLKEGFKSAKDGIIDLFDEF